MAIIKKLKTFKDKILKSTNSFIKKKSKDSIKWFRNRVLNSDKKNWAIKKMKGADGAIRDAIDEESTPFIGHLYHYIYDPKTKDDMPYYDIFPLVVIIKYYSNGFLGLNFHYLPPLLRAKLFDALLAFEKKASKYNGRRKNEKYMQLSYNLLKNMPKSAIMRPTIKRYLWSHVRSNFMHIGSDEWENVLFLPSENFKKKGKREVWKDSKKIISKYSN